MPITIESSQTTRRAPGRDRFARRARFAGFAALGLVLLFSGCRSVPNTEAATYAAALDAPVTPPFYRVEGHGGAEFALLGTLHVGPPEGWSYSDAILRSIAGADRFALELDLRGATEEAVSTQLANRVILDHTKTLSDLVSPETLRMLDENEALLVELGMGQRSRNRMKPWFVAMTLIEWISNQSGYATGSSVESFVLEAVEARPLIGLETLDEQMALFDELPLPLQDVMLQDTLARLDEAKLDMERLVQAWRFGNETELVEIAREGVDELPPLGAFYDRLLGERNRRWIEKFRLLLDSPDHADESIFVAVGALHLVGDEGLVRLLRDAGYRVEAIPQEANP